MIIDTIMGIFLGAIEGLLGLLPTTPAPPDLAGMVQQAFGWFGGEEGMSVVNEWVPLTTLSAAVAAVLVWFAAIQAFRLLAWLLCLVRVGGTDAA